MNDKEAQFSKIYDEYIGKIYRFVYLKVSSKEIAEDITSRTFIRGWDMFRKGADIKNPGGFLYRVAGNMVVDHYRSRGRTKIVGSDPLAKLVDGTADMHERAMINEGIETVRRGLAKIKQEYQDVLIWHYLEDMPASEIAQLVNKPAGTVRVMIHRGLQALKKELVQEA